VTGRSIGRRGRASVHGRHERDHRERDRRGRDPRGHGRVRGRAWLAVSCGAAQERAGADPGVDGCALGGRAGARSMLTRTPCER